MTGRRVGDELLFAEDELKCGDRGIGGVECDVDGLTGFECGGLVGGDGEVEIVAGAADGDEDAIAFFLDGEDGGGER